MLPLVEAIDAPARAQQEDELAAADLLRVYENAVDLLPPKTRRVFLMHRVDELSYQEISDIVGISVATVQYHMVKALAHLCEMLDDSE